MAEVEERLFGKITASQKEKARKLSSSDTVRLATAFSGA